MVNTAKKTTTTATKTSKTSTTTTKAMNPPALQEAPAFPFTAKEVSARGKAIRQELRKVDSAFESIAFNLYWFYDKKAFEAVGYKNIYDMASKEFGIARGTTNNFINVVDRFAERDENGMVVEKISENFRDFKSSQLIAMLGKTNEELEDISPEMSVRDIKKALKGSSDSGDSSEESGSSSSATEEAGADSDGDIIEAKEINRQVLVSFRSMKEYNAYLDSMNDYIANALKKKDNKYVVEISITW